jgi:hypothetical protein
MQATLLFFHSTAMANPRSNPREANDQKFQNKGRRGQQLEPRRSDQLRASKVDLP